jgi:hypothetical protein
LWGHLAGPSCGAVAIRCWNHPDQASYSSSPSRVPQTVILGGIEKKVSAAGSISRKRRQPRRTNSGFRRGLCGWRLKKATTYGPKKKPWGASYRRSLCVKALLSGDAGNFARLESLAPDADAFGPFRGTGLGVGHQVLAGDLAQILNGQHPVVKTFVFQPVD